MPLGRRITHPATFFLSQTLIIVMPRRKRNPESKRARLAGKHGRTHRNDVKQGAVYDVLHEIEQERGDFYEDDLPPDFSKLSDTRRELAEFLHNSARVRPEPPSGPAKSMYMSKQADKDMTTHEMSLFRRAIKWLAVSRTGLTDQFTYDRSVRLYRICTASAKKAFNILVPSVNDDNLLPGTYPRLKRVVPWTAHHIYEMFSYFTDISLNSLPHAALRESWAEWWSVNMTAVSMAREYVFHCFPVTLRGFRIMTGQPTERNYVPDELSVYLRAPAFEFGTRIVNSKSKTYFYSRVNRIPSRDSQKQSDARMRVKLLLRVRSTLTQAAYSFDPSLEARKISSDKMYIFERWSQHAGGSTPYRNYIYEIPKCSDFDCGFLRGARIIRHLHVIVKSLNGINGEATNSDDVKLGILCKVTKPTNGKPTRFTCSGYRHYHTIKKQKKLNGAARRVAQKVTVCKMIQDPSDLVICDLPPALCIAEGNRHYHMHNQEELPEIPDAVGMSDESGGSGADSTTSHSSEEAVESSDDSDVVEEALEMMGFNVEPDPPEPRKPPDIEALYYKSGPMSTAGAQHICWEMGVEYSAFSEWTNKQQRKQLRIWLEDPNTWAYIKWYYGRTSTEPKYAVLSYAYYTAVEYLRKYGVDYTSYDEDFHLQGSIAYSKLVTPPSPPASEDRISLGSDSVLSANLSDEPNNFARLLEYERETVDSASLSDEPHSNESSDVVSDSHDSSNDRDLDNALQILFGGDPSDSSDPSTHDEESKDSRESVISDETPSSVHSIDPVESLLASSDRFSDDESSADEEDHDLVEPDTFLARIPGIMVYLQGMSREARNRFNDTVLPWLKRVFFSALDAADGTLSLLIDVLHTLVPGEQEIKDSWMRVLRMEPPSYDVEISEVFISRTSIRIMNEEAPYRGISSLFQGMLRIYRRLFYDNRSTTTERMPKWVPINVTYDAYDKYQPYWWTTVFFGKTFHRAKEAKFNLYDGLYDAQFKCLIFPDLAAHISEQLGHALVGNVSGDVHAWCSARMLEEVRRLDSGYFKPNNFLVTTYTVMKVMNEFFARGVLLAGATPQTSISAATAVVTKTNIPMFGRNFLS